MPLELILSIVTATVVGLYIVYKIAKRVKNSSCFVSMEEIDPFHSTPKAKKK